MGKIVKFRVNIPDNLKRKMDKYKNANWSATAIKGIEQKIAEQEFLNEATKGIILSKENAIELGKEANGFLFKRHES